MRKWFALAIVAVMVWGVCSSNSYSQEAKTAKRPAGTGSPKAIADALMQRVEEGQLDTLYKELKPRFISPELDEKQFQANIVDQHEKLTKQLGESMKEVEFIKIDRLGNSYIVYTYVEKLERFPVIWRISLYRVANEWKVTNFNFNTNVDASLTPDKGATSVAETPRDAAAR